ncbi:MAG TPA: bifunctional 4-hydroxy-2-oxoglutarate aldolase/2-dehydro-3-deoxy-phosphogluconate aldolase [Rudaea sp.]|nr:bifunctional 4-hydroxy-2-oxoglutarate aldolase/2-dehydro-3-deoxy-phosphogluconate aldolase [Rudaea sp.]
MNTWMKRRQDELEATLRLGPALAIVTIADAADAVPLARALVDGGVRVIEITLRTPAALDAIGEIARNVEAAVPGAGTVLNADDLHAAERAGAKFVVSPGATPELLDAMEKTTLPYLPGSASASEAMWLYARGYRLQKFFPAEPAGGTGYLRAVAGPLPGIGFCPTGGIGEANAREYLKLPNVLCVGGSWLTPADLVRAGDWVGITNLARRASRLRDAA